VRHGCVDITQGAVPALLPFLIHHRGYSYAAASVLVLVLVLAMTITSSLIQPLFGHLADRRSLPWLLPGGVLVAGAGTALGGWCIRPGSPSPRSPWRGVGVGAYPPEAARYANYVSGSRRASGMSLFSVGGNVGFALGPVLVTPLVLTLGLGGTVWLIVPSVAVAVLLLCGMAHLRSFRPQATASPGAGVAPPPPPVEDRWGPFSLVAAIAAFRSGAYFGLQAFVPSYFIAHFAASAGEGNAALTVIQRAGGQLHPARPGRLLYDRQLLDHGGTGAGVPARSDRIASGVTLGAAIGIGGVTAALLGVLADHAGLTAVMLVIAALLVPALLCALALPLERRRGVEA